MQLLLDAESSAGTGAWHSALEKILPGAQLTAAILLGGRGSGESSMLVEAPSRAVIQFWGDVCGSWGPKGNQLQTYP